MKIYVHYTDSKEIFELDVDDQKTVKDIKLLAQNYFKIDTINMLGSKYVKRLVLDYAKGDLKDEWILSDLGIPAGSNLKCYVVERKIPDFEIYLKFKKEWMRFYNNEIKLDQCYVLELKIFLSKQLGFPLSSFRLKTYTNVDLFDDKYISDYNMAKMCFQLETWQGWENIIKYTIKGYSKHVIECLNSDEFIKQYQLQVMLFIAAFYGNTHLAEALMQLGARADRPVGEHPCRQWCETDLSKLEISNRIAYLKLENLKCPIHVAIENGQLRILNLIAKTYKHVLGQPDGYNLPPWRFALHNKHNDPLKKKKQKDVARFLLAQEFGIKIKITDKLSVSIHLFYKIKCWIEKAKERALELNGISKSSIQRKRMTYKSGLVGNKVLVDGYNNNFKDYSNSYERLREKYKFYYLINEDERYKNGIPDLYFRNIGLFKKTSNKTMNRNSQSEKVLNKSLGRTNRELYYNKFNPTSHNFKVIEKWKRLINRILLIKTVLHYYEIFIKLGVNVKVKYLDAYNLSQIGYYAKYIENIKNFDKQQADKLLSKKKEFSKKNLKTIQSKSTRNSIEQDESLSEMSVMSKFKNSDKIFATSISYFEEKYNEIKKKSRPMTSGYLPKEIYFEKVMDQYRKKYRPDESSSQTSSVKILQDMTRFSRSKSWLQQVDLGTRVATGKIKRELKVQRCIHTAK